MKLTKLWVAIATLAAAAGAQAQVTGSLGGGGGTFLTLSSAGLNGGSVAALSGGTTYTTDMPFADIPKGSVFGGTFLAAGPTSGPSAALTFTGGGVSYISFLWGSPDTYNLLTVNTTAGTQTFTATALGFAVTDGTQTFSQYVQFTALASSKITSLVFTNTPGFDAFETANYSISPVPEPETYALLLGGLGMMGFLVRRRSRD